jgi:hypothetical protein
MNNWFTNLVFYVNLVGSTGDILMPAFVLKYGKNAKIIDEKTGFTVVYKSTK